MCMYTSNSATPTQDPPLFSFLSAMALFRRPGVAQAFRNNRQLQQFVLTGVTPTGRVLGTGSYGSVEEVSVELLGP